jgi:molybdopterin synthase catalytic subunit
MTNKVPLIHLTREPIDRDQIIQSVWHPEAGSLVTFEGVVRNNSQGKQVHYLEYEAYVEMAEERLHAIASDVYNQWGIAQIAIVHRLGHLEVGETSVIIVVASPHRAEGFDICRYIIDTLKTTVPIWKKEVGINGEEWI